MNLFKTIIFILVLLIAFTATGAIIYLSKNLNSVSAPSAFMDDSTTPAAFSIQQDTDSTENNNQLNLAINPKSQSLRVGQTFSVYVTAQSPHEILAIDLYLSYNPQVLQLVSIEPSTYFPNPIVAKNSHDTNTGAILYSLASLSPTNKSGNLVKMTFTVKERSPQTVVSIHTDTLASLKGAIQARNNIQNGTFIIQ